MNLSSRELCPEKHSNSWTQKARGPALPLVPGLLYSVHISCCHFSIAYALAFDGNIFLSLYCRFCFFLRHEQFQDTVLELGLDVLLGDIFTNVEGTLARTGVTLAANVLTGFFLLLVLIKSLGCADG